MWSIGFHVKRRVTTLFVYCLSEHATIEELLTLRNNKQTQMRVTRSTTINTQKVVCLKRKIQPTFCGQFNDDYFFKLPFVRLKQRQISTQHLKSSIEINKLQRKYCVHWTWSLCHIFTLYSMLATPVSLKGLKDKAPFCHIFTWWQLWASNYEVNIYLAVE